MSHNFIFCVFLPTSLILLKLITNTQTNVPLFFLFSGASLCFFFISLAQSWPLFLPLCFCPTAHENRRGEKAERRHQLHLNKEEAQTRYTWYAKYFIYNWSTHGLEKKSPKQNSTYYIYIYIYTYAITFPSASVMTGTLQRGKSGETVAMNDFHQIQQWFCTSRHV